MELVLARGKRIDTGEWIYGYCERRDSVQLRSNHNDILKKPMVESHCYIYTCGKYTEVIPETIEIPEWM